MSYDTDITAIVEYNENIISTHSKVTEMAPVVLGSLENNYIFQRKNNAWESNRNFFYGNQCFQASVSGDTYLELDVIAAKNAVILTVVGDVRLFDFGANFLEKSYYTFFVQQDSVGGHTVRWPYGASIIGSVNTDPLSITSVILVKLADNKYLVRCSAFLPSEVVGTVISEFFDSGIAYPLPGSEVASTFVWVKNSPRYYGNSITDLNSDWEISEASDYSNPFFSSMADIENITSILVNVLGHEIIYLRSRYNGVIDGVLCSSAWSYSHAVVMAQDPFYDLVSICINGYSGSAEGAVDFKDEASNYDITVIGNVKVNGFNTDTPYIYSDGVDDGFSITRFDFQFLNKLITSWTIEFFISFDVYNANNALFQVGTNTNATTPNVTLLAGVDGPYGVIAGSNGSVSNVGTQPIADPNTINHIAYVIDTEAHEWRIYVNGVLRSTTSISERLGDTAYDLHFLTYAAARNFVTKGKLYSTRLTKAARYTENFSPSLNYPYFPRVPAPPKLLCSYNFGVSLEDLSGEGVTVSNVGMVIANGYIKGNGSSQYLNINKDIYSSGKVHTVSFWIKRFVSATHHFTFGLASRSPSSTAYYFRCMDLYNNAVRGTTFVPAIGGWTHVVMTFNFQRSNGVKKIYINGDLKYSGQQSFIAGTYNASKTIIQVGGWTNGVASSGLGFSLFDVYEGMFDDAGVLALYNDGKVKLGI